MADANRNKGLMTEELRVDGSELKEHIRKREPQEDKRSDNVSRNGTGTDKIELLAAEIDQLSYDSDTCRYMDMVEDREAQTACIAGDIRSGNTGYIAEFLNAAVSDHIRKGIMEVFGNGVELDESDGIKNARKAKELLDRLTECRLHTEEQKKS